MEFGMTSFEYYGLIAIASISLSVMICAISEYRGKIKLLKLEIESLESDKAKLFSDYTNQSWLLNDATAAIKESTVTIAKYRNANEELAKENKQLKEKLEYNQNKMYSNIDTTLEQVTAIRKKLDDIAWKDGGSVYYE